MRNRIAIVFLMRDGKENEEAKACLEFWASNFGDYEAAKFVDAVKSNTTVWPMFEKLVIADPYYGN